VPCDDKTGARIAKKLCSILENEGLNFGYMRGQGYNNGSNMAEIYNWVQVLILKQNAAALYLSCVAHSLNLVGVHAVNSTMVSFFGTIEKCFVFFSSSTTRWQDLIDKVKISLKSHSDTRWCSKANAVKALVTQLPELMDCMQEFSTNSQDTKTVSTADSLLNYVDFNFICLLRFWWEILFAINIVNVSLQNSQLSLNRACTLVEGLEGSLNKIRDNFDETIVNASKPIAQVLNITDRLKEKRVRKAKRQSDEIADDEARSLTAL